jgi:hypothetical protein
MLRKIVPPGFDLRLKISAAIVKDAEDGIGPEETADAIIAIVDQAMRTRCADDACVGRRGHSVLGPHLWKHNPQPPFEHFLLRGWLCLSCGRRLAHRIHNGGVRVAS